MYLQLIFRTHVNSQNSDEDVCFTEECIRTAETFRNNMDYSMDPCYDFYEFACGNYKYHTQMKFGDKGIKQKDIRDEEINRKTLGYMQSHNYDNIEVIKKAKIFFRTCINEDVIESFGDLTIPAQLTKVGLPVRPPFAAINVGLTNYAQVLARIHKYVQAQFLFTINVSADPEDKKVNRLFIEKTTSMINLFLSTEDTIANYNLFFNTFGLVGKLSKKRTKEEINELKLNIKSYMMDTVKYLYQFTQTKVTENILKIVSYRAEKVTNFLLSLQEILESEKANDDDEDDWLEYVTVQDLQEITDQQLKNSKIKFNWLSYLVTLFEGIYDVKEYFNNGEPLLVGQREILEKTFEVISTLNEEDLISLLWWIVVKELNNLATKELREIHKTFLANIRTNGFPSRETMCISLVKEKFTKVLTYLLLNESNAERDKNKIAEMTENIKSSFRDKVKKAPWLDDVTKMAALSKLDYLNAFISHEDWLKDSQIIESDYAKIDVVEDSWYMTIMNYHAQTVEDKLQLLFKKNTLTLKPKPVLSSLTVNAAYSANLNIIDIPLGVLGPPYTNLGLQCLDFGGVGSVIGHEYVHGFDSIGKHYDSFGNKANWWRKPTSSDFDKRASCLIEVYNKFYFEDIQMHVNGQKTLAENIADNGGLSLALNAYKKYVQKHGPEPKLPYFEDYSSEQLFTLALANLWCSNVTLEFIKYQLKFDRHAPNSCRVNGMFMNSKEFSEMWDCEPGSRMNPELKCNIW